MLFEIGVMVVCDGLLKYCNLQISRCNFLQKAKPLWTSAGGVSGMRPKRRISGVQQGTGAVVDIGEGKVFGMLCDIVDSAESNMLQEKAARMPHLHSVLQGHRWGMFACATDAGTRQKERDRLTFCHSVYGSKIPELDSIAWLPRQEEWLEFFVGGSFKGLFTPEIAWLGGQCL